MIGFIRAHGYDPGPTQRPLAAGALTSLLACIPAALAAAPFGLFALTADTILRWQRPLAGAATVAAFVAGGLIYGGFFRRAANDRGAGWMLGLAYGFLLWAAAPATVLPLVRGQMMAAGPQAVGFLVAFLVWGLALGLAFPAVHRPLQAGLDGSRRSWLGFGPDHAGWVRAVPNRK